MFFFHLESDFVKVKLEIFCSFSSPLPFKKIKILILCYFLIQKYPTPLFERIVSIYIYIAI